MAPKKQPTPTENSRRLDAMEKTVNNLSMRLNLLEQAKIGTDAVADYLLKHPATGSTINKELMKNIGIALSIISALVIALIQGVQK